MTEQPAAGSNPRTFLDRWRRSLSAKLLTLALASIAFAVAAVTTANEVKQLARQTASATGEIIAQIRDIQEQSSATVISISDFAAAIRAA